MRIEERISDVAAQAIAGLEADGIVLSAAEIVRLNALGWAVETPEARRHLARGVPVPVGGVYLWPQTFRAADWLERASGHCKASDEAVVVAYAMAHAYAQGDELDSSGSDAVLSAKAWARKLRATAAELSEAVDQVLAQDSALELPKSPADDKPMSIGDFSAFLAATNGGDPEFWERRCSLGYALAYLSHAVRFNMAEGMPVVNDPKIQATMALGLLVDQIREARKAASDG
jgi:hypothetical protein